LIISITPTTNTMQITPTQAGDTGHPSGAVTQFTSSPSISLEEAVAIYLDTSTLTIRRTTATDMSSTTSPTWAGANDLVANAVSLTFTYYDKFDNVISPSTLANRALVARVDAQVVVQTSAALSNGQRPRIALPVRSIPRNLRVR
jgi:hypothetical protein